MPYQAACPDRRASPTDPTTWGSFAQATAVENVDGVGFVFTEQDPFTGVDLDNCLDENGDMHPAAAAIVKALDGYTETSPSGSGVHVIIKGRLHGGRNRTSSTSWGGSFEIYDRARYFTVTGDGRGDVAERQEALDQVVAAMLPVSPGSAVSSPTSHGTSGLDDEQLLQLAFRAKNGSAIEALYNGDTSAYGGDASRADIALCGYLAFYTGRVHDRIDKLFRRSGLMREKWDERRGDSTYGRITIEKAFSAQGGSYTTSGRPGTSGSVHRHSAVAGATSVEQDWLSGAPMDPASTPTEGLPTLPGFLYLHAGMGALIVGPTGGGRSSLIQAGMYDGALLGLRAAYLGSEVTNDEFDVRSALLADLRGDHVNDELRGELARVRYLDLQSTMVSAFENPESWVADVVDRFDLVAIDPLAAVASALDLDFEKSNTDYSRFYDRLVGPLVTKGVAVVLADNVGHAADARKRAKGASAKSDRADLTFSCAKDQAGLLLRAEKVRSRRVPFQTGDRWLFVKDTQRVKRRHEDSANGGYQFRPTEIMQRVSELVGRDPGLNKTAIRRSAGCKAQTVDLALELLIAEGYIELKKRGSGHEHRSLKPYSNADDLTHESHESRPSPARVPDPSVDPESDQVPLPVGKGLGRGLGSEPTDTDRFSVVSEENDLAAAAVARHGAPS